jgi:hypothetical protein
MHACTLAVLRPYTALLCCAQAHPHMLFLSSAGASIAQLAAAESAINKTLPWEVSAPSNAWLFQMLVAVPWP